MARITGGRESALVRTILHALEKVPGICVRKRHGTAMGKAGDPDISGCLEGQHFELEVKRPGNEPTPLQWARLAEWHAAGARIGVVHNAREARACLGLNEES
jgi:hypothetical protein